MPEPNWNTPAHLMGMPYTNWKKRLGHEMRGTLAECLARWLDLPKDQMRWCELVWDDPATGAYGRMGSAGMGSYVIAHGLPPAVAAARGGQPPVERLREIVATARYEPAPGRPRQPGLEYSIYRGKKK